MDELIKSLQPIFAKIADFFDLFDLSFIVSGVISSSAVFFILYQNGIALPGFTDLSGLQVFFLIVNCYVAGLISWMLGKRIRGLNPKFYKIKEKFASHNSLGDSLYTKYAHNGKREERKDIEDGLKALYGLLWAKIRENPKIITSFSLLKRYWVMTATFDGLVASFFLWALVMLVNSFCSFGTFFQLKRIDTFTVYGVCGAILFFLIGLLAKKEAMRYKEYQMGELVDTYLESKT